MFDVFGIGREQHQCTQSGGSDGIALGDGLCSVADCIQRVRSGTNGRIKIRHFSDTTCIIGHRTKRIQRHNHARQRQHGRHRNGDPQQARRDIGEQDTCNDHNGRNGCRFQRNSQTLDHIGAVSGHRRLRDRTHRATINRSIIFGHIDNRACHHQSGDAAHEQLHGRQRDTRQCRQFGRKALWKDIFDHTR